MTDPNLEAALDLAYDALKNNFEIVLLQLVTRAVNGDDWLKDYDAVKAAFDTAVDNSNRMSKLLQRQC